MKDDATAPRSGSGPERLVLEFFSRMWGAHDLGAIDELMTPDYGITSAGHEIRGCQAFKGWVDGGDGGDERGEPDRLHLLPRSARGA